VHEKLNRADEIIRSLDSEITAFLKPPEAGFSNNKQKAANELLQHARRQVPPRFGIIAGEVAHHLRSSLDHIAWLLSCHQYQRSHEGAISFPILTEKPRKKAELGSYSRKLEGIQSAAARALIERLQPYHASTPADDPLAITHKLDRVDKHQALVLVEAVWNMNLTLPPIRSWMISGFDVNHESSAPQAADNVKLQFNQYIAFAEFGERKRQPVIPSLMQLAAAVRGVVRQFSE
jgi:hypothetical protein